MNGGEFPRSNVHWFLKTSQNKPKGLYQCLLCNVHICCLLMLLLFTYEQPGQLLQVICAYFLTRSLNLTKKWCCRLQSSLDNFGYFRNDSKCFQVFHSTQECSRVLRLYIPTGWVARIDEAIIWATVRCSRLIQRDPSEIFVLTPQQPYVFFQF